MFTVTSSGSWDLDDLARSMREAMRDIGRDLAALVKREQLAAARAAGAPRRFGGYPIGVTTKVYARADSVDVDVSASPAGFWAMLQSGRRGGYTVRPRRRRAVTTPKGPAASVRIGRSVPGRRIWSRATDAVGPLVEREVVATLDARLGA